MFHVPENNRVRFTRRNVWSEQDGNNGTFWLRKTALTRDLMIIASDGEGWEHVSVHAEGANGKTATPNWAEMCRVKDVFWDAEDVVMQIHPRQSQYVNNHPHVLHLWRPTNATIPEPPSILVGVVGAEGRAETEAKLRELGYLTP